jgi:hypothetical protein
MTIVRALYAARVSLAVSGILACHVSGCEQDAFIGHDRAALSDAAIAMGGSEAAGGSGGGTAATGGVATCQPTSCQGHVYACGDCADNDGDGKIDMDDPDCLGPCHNAEDTFFGSIAGQNHQACVSDCYFDQDSGFGNDGCLWSSKCDPRAPEGAACPYDPKASLPRQGDCASLATTQVPGCATVCGPLTPNGCDCFGCCEVPGAATPVFVGSVDPLGNPTCDLAHVGDPARCRPCTQVEACRNPCDACERCVGKTELPPSCNPGSTCPAPICPAGEHPCGASCLPACPSGQACITGCCVAPPR